MSYAEKLLWPELRKLKLNIRRQAPIGRFVADFAHHETRLIIEVDGPWHDKPEAQLRDVERTAWLESQGHRVIRFTTKQVERELPVVVEAIQKAIVSPPRTSFSEEGGKALWRARHQWERES